VYSKVHSGGSDNHSPAVGADGMVYVGSRTNDHKLYTVTPEGQLKWSFTTGGAMQSSLAVGADVVRHSRMCDVFVNNPLIPFFATATHVQPNTRKQAFYFANLKFTILY
jgi:outer membrane protein assembly factor BamB